MIGTEVADGVVVLPVPMGPGLSTAVVVLSGERTVLVDAGPAEVGPAAVRACLADRALPPVDRVICTHFHHDHTGGAAELATDSTVVVQAHVAEVGMITAPGGFTQALAQLGIAVAPPTSAGVPVAPLLGGARLAVGDRSWEVVHVPGHTWGHLAMWSSDDQLLVAGDAVQGEGVPYRGVPGLGTGLPYYLDVTTYRDSLRKMVALAPSTLVLSHENPGWEGRVLRGQGVVLDALEGSLAETDELHRAVRRSVDGLGSTPDEVAARVCSDRELGPATPQAELTVRAHLQLARVEGSLEVDRGRWYPRHG